MHQSPEKMTSRRRDKYADADLADERKSRRAPREEQPKARRFAERDEAVPEPRWDKKDARR